MSRTSGWERRPLSDLLSLCREPVEVITADRYPNLGLFSFGRGVFPKPPIDGNTTSARTLYRVRAGQFIYSKLFAFEGAFAVVPHNMDGWYVSNEYPVFDVDTNQMLVDFARLAICRPIVWKEMAAMTVGLGHRRQRLHPDAFLAYEIALPPVQEQQRIVDMVSAVEALLADLERELLRAGRAWAAARERLMEHEETIQLGEVLAGIDGGLGSIPKGLDRPPEEGEWGIVKVSAVRPGEFFPEEAKTLPASVHITEKVRIREGDVLLTRCSGSARFVGAACRVPRDPGRLILTDFVLRLRFEARIDADFMVEALASRAVRDQVEGDIDRSTTLRSVSKTRLRSLEVPCPSRERQRSIASALKAFHDTERRTRAELEAAKNLRASLVNVLLAADTRPNDAAKMEELARA